MARREWDTSKSGQVYCKGGRQSSQFKRCHHCTAETCPCVFKGATSVGSKQDPHCSEGAIILDRKEEIDIVATVNDECATRTVFDTPERGNSNSTVTVSDPRKAEAKTCPATTSCSSERTCVSFWLFVDTAKATAYSTPKAGTCSSKPIGHSDSFTTAKQSSISGTTTKF